jgi:hypothetical protein
MEAFEAGEQRNGTGKQSLSSLPAVPFLLSDALSLLLGRNRVDRYIRSTEEIWDAPFRGVALKRFQRNDAEETLDKRPNFRYSPVIYAQFGHLE